MSPWSRPTARRSKRKGSNGSCSASSSKYQWYRSNGYWNYEPIKVTRRVADGMIDVAPDKPGKISVPVSWGRYRLEVTSADPQGPETTYGFDAGFYAEASADTPDLLEIALDKKEYKPGDCMTVAVTARSAGQGDARGDRRQAAHHHDDRRAAWTRQASDSRSARTGARAPMCSRRSGVRSTRPRSACPAAPSACSGSASTRRRIRIGVAMDLPELIRPETTLRVPIKFSGLAPNEAGARRRRPRSMSASSTSPITRRPTPTLIISASASSPPRSATSTAS